MNYKFAANKKNHNFAKVARLWSKSQSEWGRERMKIITRQLMSMIFLSLIKLVFISIHSVYFILSIGVKYNGNFKK